MREDFSKVVTERPRRGSRLYRYRDIRDRAPIGEDDAGFKQGMARPHRERKEFSDLINPLRRFLMTRTGKNYDKVYSEVCAQLKGRSTQLQHIIDHLKQYVDTNVVIGDDGKLRSNTHRAYWSKDSDWISLCDFYVDPRTGQLRRTPKGRSWRRNKHPDPLTALKKDGVSYEKIDGLWFEVNETTVTDSYRSMTDGRLLYYERTVKTKRSLNGKELKALGLTNDDDPD